MTKLTRGAVLAIATILGTGSALAQDGDVKAGEAVYKKCGACHFYDKEKNRVGPHLVGIVGRKAGVVEKYKYSKALKKMADEGLVWDVANLDKYLEKPRAFIKRGKMAFAGLKKPKDRADVIAFLKEKAKVKE